MYDVISFGAATVDVIVKSEAFIQKENFLSLPCSSKNEVSQGLICSGGGATNSSVTFSRQGLTSACVSLVGSDLLANYITADLAKEHVTNLLATDTNPTDYSVILVGADGGRSILTNRGKSRLEEDHLKWEDYRRASWFYVTSLEGNMDLLEKLIGFAVESNIKVSLNPGSRELQKLSQLRPLFKYVDFLQFNQTESQVATGCQVNTDRFWSTLENFGTSMVAVTDGRNGAYILHSGQKYYSPIKNTTPVEETGAGDAFGSAFVSGLIHGLPPQDALYWGIKNSASVVSFMGAKAGILTFDQISK
ncbi:MAG: carbohydrate kinase family protein [Candidatus Shapirobacteria bacterium]|jgi:sugar/nucleoside kinase (ribokinase family)